ncbi:MAG TPA: NlpC/P60 family protein [Allosphingosinicella sp.]|nr:NlpC/P60 family protein [Allosphingosinicella sp.]
MSDEPSESASAVSQLLPGEEFAVLDVTAGWAWGYCALDHRVGYVAAIHLTDPVEPSHVVIEASAPIQSGCDPLSHALAHLPMGSRLCGKAQGARLQTEAGSVPLSYLRPIGDHESDPVDVARRLLGAPYLPGGRTHQGMDCAGLVQLSLQLCGIDAPRDAREQRGLGRPVKRGEPPKRGDLVFCADHVAMMVDDCMVIHVGWAARKVAVEPLAAVSPRACAMPVELRRLDRGCISDL